MNRVCSIFLLFALLVWGTTGFRGGDEPSRPIVLPPDLVGKVLQVDAKWQFLVLDMGADQGVLNRAEMLVNRGGRLVAKVKITRVEKDQCIADIVPGWKLTEVLDGDQVIPAAAYLPSYEL